MSFIHLYLCLIRMMELLIWKKSKNVQNYISKISNNKSSDKVMGSGIMGYDTDVINMCTLTAMIIVTVWIKLLVQALVVAVVCKVHLKVLAM